MPHVTLPLPHQPPCTRLSKGNNRADRIRITSDRAQIRFLLDTPDEYIGHAGEILVLSDDECEFIFGDGSTLEIDAHNVYIEPPIFGLDSTNVYDALVEILGGTGTDDQVALEVPINLIANIPGATEVQTALEYLAQTPITIPDPIIIASGTDLVVDSHTPTTQTTYEWTVTVIDTVNGEYRSSKVLAVYDGIGVTHQVYQDVGDFSVKRIINVDLVLGVVELSVDNTDTNPQRVKVARFPIIET